MKRLFFALALLFGLASTAQAQTRVAVSLSFGGPYHGGHVWVGQPYHRDYSRSYYHRYHRAPLVVVAPRIYRSPRVVVVRPHRAYGRSHRRNR